MKHEIPSNRQVARDLKQPHRQTCQAAPVRPEFGKGCEVADADEELISAHTRQLMKDQFDPVPVDQIQESNAHDEIKKTIIIRDR